MLFSLQFHEAPTMVGLKIFQTVYKRTLCEHSSVAYVENFHGGFHTVAYGGHLHLVCALCDVAI